MEQNSTYQPPHADAGARIRSARKRAGLSHDNVISLMGRSTRQHLIKLEQGWHKATPELIAAIAEATGTTVEALEESSAAPQDDEEAAEPVGDFELLFDKMLDRSLRRREARLARRAQQGATA